MSIDIKLYRTRMAGKRADVLKDAGESWWKEESQCSQDYTKEFYFLGDLVTLPCIEKASRFSIISWDDIPRNKNLLGIFKENLKCIGCYSEDDDKKFVNDKSSLRLLNTKFLPDGDSKEMEIHLELQTTEENYKKYTGTSEDTLNNFLSFILGSGEARINELKKTARDGGMFLLSKRLLVSILQDPYKHKNPLGFYAKYMDGFIYMKVDNISNEIFSSNTLASNFGHRFKELLVSDENNTDLTTQNTNFRCVFKSIVGKHNVCHSSRIDSFDPELYDEGPIDMSAAICLRSCGTYVYKKPEWGMERFFDWCLGIYLTGEAKLLVGQKDKKGRSIQALRLYSEDDLIQMGKRHWDFGVCFEFADKLLSFVKNQTKSKPGTAFLFRRESDDSHFTCTEEADVELPPEWFLKEMKNMSG